MNAAMHVLAWVALGLLLAAVVTVGQLIWSDATKLLRRRRVGVSGRG